MKHENNVVFFDRFQNTFGSSVTNSNIAGMAFLKPRACLTVSCYYSTILVLIYVFLVALKMAYISFAEGIAVNLPANYNNQNKVRNILATYLEGEIKHYYDNVAGS